MFLNFHNEEFNKFYSYVNERLASLLIPVINGENYNALDVAKEIDRIVYKYTGNEDLIVYNQDDKEKVIFVEDQVDFFYNYKDKIKELVLANDKRINLSEIEILVGLFSHVIFMHIVGVDPELFFKSVTNPPKDFVDDSTDE